MKKLLFALFVIVALPVFAQNVDLAIGAGHTWTGSGSYLYGQDRRDLNFQLASKVFWDNGAGVYAGYTQDAVKFVSWTNKHNFSDLDTSGLKRLKSLDLGAMYILRGDRLNGWAAAGAAGYDALGDTGMGWFLAVGGDVVIYKALFLEVKAEYRSNVTNFLPMDASCFETGLLLGWRF